MTLKEGTPPTGPGPTSGQMALILQPTNFLAYLKLNQTSEFQKRNLSATVTYLATYTFSFPPELFISKLDHYYMKSCQLFTRSKLRDIVPGTSDPTPCWKS